jgi:menaquinone-dependent protoporphyrinogen oxidase
VLGSAVYIKRWRGTAKRFLHKYAKQLAQRPFWVFSSGPAGEPRNDPNPAWLEPPKIVERLGARERVVFGGRMPVNPRSPTARAMVKNCPPAYRDRRNWDEINAWAARIASQLHDRIAAAPSARKAIPMKMRPFEKRFVGRTVPPGQARSYRVVLGGGGRLR